MHIESVTLNNFRCFGPKSASVELDSRLTALVGANGSGKTAVCIALMRVFGISQEQRTVRVDDFHVPPGETDVPSARTLTVEVILSFPEFDTAESENTGHNSETGDDPAVGDSNTGPALHGSESDVSDRSAHDAVPEFFHQMAATVDGKLKCRIVLEATWTDDGSIDGSIDDQRRVVYTFDEDYGDQWVPLRPGDRNRIQVVYVPASRDGARYLTTFLKGRLWRASTWSAELEGHVAASAEEITRLFRAEPAVSAVEQALSVRWRELHQADTDSDPLLEPGNRSAKELAGKAELMFNPSHQGRHRPAAALSDGQRSLLQLALTAATLDLEGKIAVGKSAFRQVIWPHHRHEFWPRHV